jgi:hypothetical protein
MLFFLAFHFSLSLTPNCRNWSPNYSVLVLLDRAQRNDILALFLILLFLLQVFGEDRIRAFGMAKFLSAHLSATA